MLSSGYNPNSRENFLKIKMEEQTVPSAGFSPQPEYMSQDCGSNNYYSVQHQNNGPAPMHHAHHQQQQQAHHHQPQQMQQSVMNDCFGYSNLADSFDLSLLGDSYDDRDMATVPSPSSWSPLGAMEPTTWQQVSFYAASPPEFRAFSPDCTPVKQFVDMNANNGKTGSSNNTTAPANNSGNNGGGSNGTGMGSPGMLDGLAYQGATAASVVDVNNPLSNDDVTNCSRNILLRQYLEDNSFIEKYGKPLDLPITSLPTDVESTMDNTVPTGATTAVGSTTLELNQIEPVFNLAYEQIISDIQNSCRTLAISPDPMQWSVGDVQSWICYSLTSILGMSSERGNTANSSATTSNIQALWNIDGQSICSMAEEDFRRRDPLNGEKIFANLELLKMAQWKSAENQQQSSSTGDAFDLGQILLGSVVPSPAPSSSSSSSSSISGAYSSASPASCSSMDHSPSPPAASYDDIKVELEDSHGNNSPAKFSSPSSVDTSSIRNSDDDEEEEEEEEKPVGKVKPVGTKNGAHIHLWQFLKELLASGQQHGSCIRWLDQSRGVFKIEDSVRVARLWGIRKNRPAMNYDKLSRSIRQYYRKGIMRKTERSQRLVYQFCHPYGL